MRTPQTPAIALAAATAAVAWRARHLRHVAREFRSPVVMLALPATRGTLPLVRAMGTAAGRQPSSEDERLSTPGADGVSREALLYRPRGGTSRGGLLWIHGGGRVSGIPQFDDIQCRRLADDAGVTVLSVNYRLAPEHPFPAALDDCATALSWFTAWCAANDIPGPLAIGGASAGGGLAAELAQRATDEGIELAHQVLVYPMLDDRSLGRGATNRGRLVWTPTSNRFAWSAYLGHPAGASEQRPYAVAARREDLRGLPSAWIGVGDLDLFHDEDVHYARRLRDAGVRVHLRVEPGMYHGADAVPGVKDSDRIRAFHADMSSSLRHALDLVESSHEPRDRSRDEATDGA
ncbi:MAG: alpha/beta hydrolase [Actinomycetales bacterium]|jgi:acetyl esterase/lipase|uniref:Alpha/beta hydrolase n=1 Tax=Candidatus Phosphoribacter hodrii TaxID=2953743 RepID=A0A9D7XTT6_9MICO|nr:alpha/beta hydrolase [Candidatus Phosphoribacter hodrii]OPZ53447.1 MAG: Carboxylesterase NlhH [bacterium ADurb.BinA028]